VVRGELRIHQVSADHDTIVWERAPAAEVASILDGYLNAV
jgi:hypothetical protein